MPLPFIKIVAGPTGARGAAGPTGALYVPITPFSIKRAARVRAWIKRQHLETGRKPTDDELRRKIRELWPRISATARASIFEEVTR